MAKYSGRGWHFQSQRHSNARRTGRAGGNYATHSKLLGYNVSSPRHPNGRFFEKLEDAKKEMDRQMRAGASSSGISEVYQHPDDIKYKSINQRAEILQKMNREQNQKNEFFNITKGDVKKIQSQARKIMAMTSEELTKNFKGKKLPFIYYDILEDANFHAENDRLTKMGVFGKFETHKYPTGNIRVPKEINDEPYNQYKKLGGKTWQL